MFYFHSDDSTKEEKRRYLLGYWIIICEYNYDLNLCAFNVGENKIEGFQFGLDENDEFWPWGPPQGP